MDVSIAGQAVWRGWGRSALMRRFREWQDSAPPSLLERWPSHSRAVAPRGNGPVAAPDFSPLEPIFAGHTDVPHAFREQFFRSPEEGFQVVLEGAMDQVWFRPLWLRPLFRVLGWMGILVPHTGDRIPAELRVGTARTPDGAPIHVWDRFLSFATPERTVRFRTKIVYDPALDEVVDLVGPGDVLYMVWYARFHAPGDLTLNTAGVALNLWGRLWLPSWLWRWTLGTVRFLQRAEGPDSDTIRICLRVRHPLFGDVFGYDGAFRTRRVARSPVERA
jgi:hypothetical protein